MLFFAIFYSKLNIWFVVDWSILHFGLISPFSAILMADFQLESHYLLLILVISNLKLILSFWTVYKLFNAYILYFGQISCLFSLFCRHIFKQRLNIYRLKILKQDDLMLFLSHLIENWIFWVFWTLKQAIWVIIFFHLVKNIGPFSHFLCHIWLKMDISGLWGLKQSFWLI